MRNLGELPSPLDWGKMEQIMAELEEGQRSCVRSCLTCWQVNAPLTASCALRCGCADAPRNLLHPQPVFLCVSLRSVVLSVLSDDPALPA